MSGFKVNFSVNNQLATPSIHAAALANRPAAGQPGRLFVDTDNPSTGIYRDTGVAWINITGGSTGGGDLQTVTDSGNTTTNQIVLQYNSLFNGSNSLELYDTGTAAARYTLNKIGSGNKLALQSNSPLSSQDMGFIINGPQDIINSFFGANEVGLKLDFSNNIFILGNPNVIAGIAGGIKVDTNNNATTIGDFNLSNNATTLFIDDNNGIIKSTYFYSDKGIKLDFGVNIYSFGDYNSSVNGTFLAIDDTNQRLEVSGNLASGTAGGSSGQHLKIRVGGVDYKIALLNP